MSKLEFKDFIFKEVNDEVEVTFLKIFYFNIKKEELNNIGEFNISKNSIKFPKIKEEKARKLFLRLLNKSFSYLRNKLNDNPALYIHKNSGIPLIGNLSFGIIDKGIDMLELKPITGCNINCIFCSVDEGLDTKKCLDIVIEKDYLVEETRKLLEFKKQPVHIYINPHGEPLLYADIVELVRDLSKLNYVNAISIITNATLLTESLAEQLIEASLTELNVSINALDPKKAKELAGTDLYDIEKITKVLDNINGKIKVILAPVFMRGINNKDIEDLIVYCKKNNFELLIQNFLLNKRGRKPAKELPFDEFYQYLKDLEKKYDIKLIKNGKIEKTNELQKPFRKGELIEVEIISKGRYNNECIAKAKERVITVKCFFERVKKQKIKLTKDQHNIFYG